MGTRIQAVHGGVEEISKSLDSESDYAYSQVVNVERLIVSFFSAFVFSSLFVHCQTIDLNTELQQCLLRVCRDSNLFGLLFSSAC